MEDLLSHNLSMGDQIDYDDAPRDSLYEKLHSKQINPKSFKQAKDLLCILINGRKATGMGRVTTKGLMQINKLFLLKPLNILNQKNQMVQLILKHISRETSVCQLMKYLKFQNHMSMWQLLKYQKSEISKSQTSVWQLLKNLKISKSKLEAKEIFLKVSISSLSLISENLELIRYSCQ